MQNNHRYYQLDALRGVCAIIVVLSHFSYFLGFNFIKYSGCAVDFFFILSGFIIIHSYGNKIISGMCFKDFLRTRYLRLAPLNIMATVIGAVACLFSVLSYVKVDQDILGEMPLAFLNAILFLPYFTSLSWPYGSAQEVSGIFPLNLPAWSLFFEFFIGIFCYAYIRLFKKIPSLLFGILAYITFLISIIIYKDTNAGWASGNFLLGFPRVFGCFFTGALIYKLHELKIKLKPGYKIKFLLLLITVLFFTTANETMAFINSLIIMPIMVLIFSYEDNNLKNKWIYTLFGFISYPLYILHIPLFTIIFMKSKFLFGYDPFNTLLVLMAIVLICSFIMGNIDLKFRKLFARSDVSKIAPRVSQNY